MHACMLLPLPTPQYCCYCSVVRAEYVGASLLEGVVASLVEFARGPVKVPPREYTQCAVPLLADSQTFQVASEFRLNYSFEYM